MSNNDITTTAIGLVRYLQHKGFKSFIIGKVANLILLDKTQKDIKVDITGIILTSATHNELSNIFKQYTAQNDKSILHFGLYDFSVINTNDIDKYRKHQSITMDALMYDGYNFIDYKNAKQCTLDNVISLNDKFNPYTFKYILKQKASYDYEVDIDTIAQMTLNKDYFIDIPPRFFFDKPYCINTLKFLNEYELCDCNKYKSHYNKLFKHIDTLQKLLNEPFNFNAVEIYYLFLHTDDGLSDIQKLKYQWVVNNYNIFNSNAKQFRVNLINTIFDNSFILEQGMAVLRELIETLYHIKKVRKEIDIKREDIIYNMCCRPLFPRQLHISDNQIQELYHRCDLQTKKEILLYIAQLDSYPTNGLYEYLKNIKQS